MKFGVERYTPVAPLTCQFGKNDVLTRTGTPVRDTWNDTRVRSWWTRVTATRGTGRRLRTRAAAGWARCQVAGPLATRGRSMADPSLNHRTATQSCHSCRRA